MDTGGGCPTTTSSTGFTPVAPSGGGGVGGGVGTTVGHAGLLTPGAESHQLQLLMLLQHNLAQQQQAHAAAHAAGTVVWSWVRRWVR